jgi:hypothetical protein
MAEDSKNWWSELVSWVHVSLMALIIYFLWVTGGEGLRSVELVVLLIILAILVIKFMIEVVREEMTNGLRTSKFLPTSLSSLLSFLLSYTCMIMWNIMRPMDFKCLGFVLHC